MKTLKQIWEANGKQFPFKARHLANQAVYIIVGEYINYYETDIGNLFSPDEPVWEEVLQQSAQAYKTLSECYKEAGNFPFLVETEICDEFLIVGKNFDWYVDSEETYWSDNFSNFKLLDYFEQPSDNLSERATARDYTTQFSWQAPADCKACAPYWSVCKCGGEK